MSGVLHSTRANASVPDIGLSVPTATVHVLWLAVAAGLCLIVFESPLWLAIGLSVAVAGMLVPNFVPTWWLVLVLGVSQLWREPVATDVVFYLLLAGVHLLHVLGSIARLLPWVGQMQLVALVRPFKRFVIVQAVAQPVAVCALLAFGGGNVTVPGLSIVAAVLLGCVGAVFARGLREWKSSG